MKAKEYYNSTRMVETKNWTLDMVMNFAEEYYEERTKALTIPDVSDTFSADDMRIAFENGEHYGKGGDALIFDIENYR